METSRRRGRASTLGLFGAVAFLATCGAFLTNSAQAVGTSPTTTTLGSNANPAVYGQSVSLTAVVAPVAPATATPTGNVTFTDGATTLATRALVNGVATYTRTYSVGTKNIVATYNGGTTYAVSSSPALAQLINPTPTATTITANPNPTSVGSSVTFTATTQAVAPGAGAPSSGSIKFYDGATLLTSRTPAVGVASFTTSSLAVGNHNITASFTGSTSYVASTSAALVETVFAGVSTTTLTSNANPSTFGDPVTFTATVTGVGTPTGTVTFLDGATTIGSTTLVGGSGSVTSSSLAAGTRLMTAAYAGDTSNPSSTSVVLTQTVNRAPTSTAAATSQSPSTFGQTVELTATVTSVAGTPTGTVAFTEGATTLGTPLLVNGIATLSISTLPTGTHSIEVAYSGDASFAVSTTSPLTQIVDAAPAATATTLVSSANPASYLQSIDLTATVSSGAGNPTGTVQFFDGATSIGSATITDGEATISTSTLTGGAHSLTASYPGNGAFAASASAVLNQTVDPLATTAVASAAPNRIVAGQLVTTTATVTASTGTPTGLVTFRDGTTIIGTAPLNGGQASLGVTNLVVGTHTLRATYAGDGNFATSTATTTATILAPILLVDRNHPACANSTSAGTSAKPFCTINYAAGKASPGQTVQVAAGSYPERVTVAVGGSAGLPVTFTPAPGATVTMSGVSNAFTMSAKSWVTIHGFTIDHTTAAGIAVTGSSNVIIDANHVTFAGQPVSGSTAPGIKLTSTTNSSVTNNVTDHNSDAGILITTDANNNVIAHNESFANARAYTRAAAGIDLRNSTGLVVTDNRTHDNEDSGINVWTGLTYGSSTVANNIAYANGDHGIDVHNSVDARIVANTVVENSDSGIEMTTSLTVTLNNNVSVDNGINSPRTSGNIRADKASVTGGCVVNDDLVFLRTAGTMIDWNGVKYTNLAAFRIATGLESRGLQADPLFTSAAGADFHLLIGSPAIDSANSGATGQPVVDDDGVARFDVTSIPDTGIGPVTYADRGAFEYHT